MTDKQSSGDPWLAEPPAIKEFADNAVKISKAFAALEKAFHELQQDIRRQDSLSHTAVQLYEHRYRIERDVARQLERELRSSQAKIDSLMMEYCPDEMTDEQLNEWSKSQMVVVDGICKRPEGWKA